MHHSFQYLGLLLVVERVPHAACALPALPVWERHVHEPKADNAVRVAALLHGRVRGHALFTLFTGVMSCVGKYIGLWI